MTAEEEEDTWKLCGGGDKEWDLGGSDLAKPLESGCRRQLRRGFTTGKGMWVEGACGIEGTVNITSWGYLIEGVYWQELVNNVGRDEYAVIVECSTKDLRCSVVGHWISLSELGRGQREAMLGSIPRLPNSGFLKKRFLLSLPGDQGKKPHCLGLQCRANLMLDFQGCWEYCL